MHKELLAICILTHHGFCLTCNIMLVVITTHWLANWFCRCIPTGTNNFCPSLCTRFVKSWVPCAGVRTYELRFDVYLYNHLCLLLLSFMLNVKLLLFFEVSILELIWSVDCINNLLWLSWFSYIYLSFLTVVFKNWLMVLLLCFCAFQMLQSFNVILLVLDSFYFNISSQERKRWCFVDVMESCIMPSS